MGKSNIKNNTPSQNLKVEQKNGFVAYSAKKVQKHESKTSNHIIEDMITPGLNILAGPFKSGKSRLCLQIALCVAQGKKIFGRDVVEGRVLYMALEDNIDRIEARLNSTLNYGDAPEKLDFSYDVNGIKGIEEGLPSYLAEHKDTKLVIIDIEQIIRGYALQGQNKYGYGYTEIGTLKELADTYGVAILFVTHTRKTPDKANLTNQIVGGIGVCGVADTLIQLDNKQGMSKPSTLSIKGRDIIEQAIQIKFNKETHLWEYVETKEEILLS